MSIWRNAAGRPLSSTEWLVTHHRAKLPERTAFVKKLLSRNPRKIVDLGCGPGLWLGLIDEYALRDCEVVGIDSNCDALAEARASRVWKRAASFVEIDIDSDATDLPEADLFLAFNIFPYLRNSSDLLETLKGKLSPGGAVIVRQYDGALLRLGPRPQDARSLIDLSVQASVLGSTQFRHYDMDHVFELLGRSGFENVDIDFELFRRFTPFDTYTSEYIRGTVEWEKSLVSDAVASLLDSWIDAFMDAPGNEGAYISTIDLVAFLSRV